jgi:predicted adenylyl cyclase CyaB
MQEIEVKILETSPEKVEEALVKMGAEKTFDGVMETFFYDFKDGSIVKAGNVLRLRKENETVVLAFKYVTATREAKKAQEYSVVVSELAPMQQILSSLGLVLTETMKKHRTSYHLGNVHFDFDQYLGKYSYIPGFLEIEAESIESIHRYAEKLGFKPEDCLPWSTAQVIQHYQGKTEGH